MQIRFSSDIVTRRGLYDLLRREIHVWHIPITPSLFKRYSLYLLSQEEKKVFKSFVQNGDKMRFLITRVALKQLLSIYLDTPIRQIHLRYNKEKKPFINQKIHFNVTHAGSKSFIAFDLKPIGIDIEDKKRSIHHDILFQEILSSQEKIHYNALENLSQKKNYLLEIWTKKEAYLKAIGCGIMVELNKIQNLKWRIYQMFFTKNYVGCLVFHSRKKIYFFHYKGKNYLKEKNDL